VLTDKIRVTELPVGTWTYDFKELLETLMEKSSTNPSPVIKDYNDMSTDVVVDFTITFQRGKLEDLETDIFDHYNGVEKLLKLYCLKSTTNMHLFDADEKLRKYESVSAICDAFHVKRLEIYVKRKEAQLMAILKALTSAQNKMRYLEELLSGTIDLRNMKRQAILEMFSSKGYEPELLKMPMDMVSEDNVQKCVNELRDLEQQYVELQSKSVEEIWHAELVDLEKHLI